MLGAGFAFWAVRVGRAKTPVGFSSRATSDRCPEGVEFWLSLLRDGCASGATNRVGLLLIWCNPKPISEWRVVWADDLGEDDLLRLPEDCMLEVLP